MYLVFFFYRSVVLRDLHSFPTRRSSDLYGDVLPLLVSFDDRLVVFGSGDEVALDFDPSKLPPTPKGWVRDYFLDRKSTRLNSSHANISYAVFCLKKKKKYNK